MIAIANPEVFQHGQWRPCTGCHEHDEGHPTGAWSQELRCHLGSGCFECGGLGAVWEQAPDDSTAAELEPPAAETLRKATLDWARADRTADDLAAKLERVEGKIHMFMMSRPHGIVATQSKPEHTKLVWARDAASKAFKEACEREHAAEEAWKELAHAMLSAEDPPEPAPATEPDG